MNYAICIYVLGHYFGNQVTFRIAICGKITRLTEVYTTDPYCENQAKQGFTEKLPELDPVASSPSSVYKELKTSSIVIKHMCAI